MKSPISVVVSSTVRKSRFTPVLLLLGMLAIGGLWRTQGQSASPPSQPESGPGGRDYAYASVVNSSFGEGRDRYWIFEPMGATSPLPVVVFLHGWGALEPDGYRAWIDHLVKRGNIVIYPQFQANLLEPALNMTPAAVGAVKEALANLGSRADDGRFAIVGHSIGGVVAMNLCGRVQQESLPKCRAVSSVTPGDSKTDGFLGSQVPSILEPGNYGQIPPDTLVHVIVADADLLVGEETAKTLYESIPQVPITNKEYLRVNSDRYGSPPLVADHFFPSSPPAGSGSDRSITDALDFFATWKLFDALVNAAFRGEHMEVAFGATARQMEMGQWSDGNPVNQLAIRPAVAAGGITNGASYASQPVAPGEIVSVFGKALGPREPAGLRLDPDGRVSTFLSGTRVTFDGTPAVMLFAASGQINLVVPYRVRDRAATVIRVERASLGSLEIEVPVAAAAPGIFTLDSSGSGQGAILNNHGGAVTVNSPEAPAPRGSVISVFATGEGSTTSSEDGLVIGTDPPTPLQTVTATVGTLPARVVYAGGAPSLVAGVLQVNIEVPANAPTGPSVPIRLQVGDRPSQEGVTVAIQ